MKSFFILVSMLSLNAFACPNLTGSFYCNSGVNSSAFDMQIENTNEGYSIITNGTEMKYHTDGRVDTIPATDSYKDVKIKASCQGEKFIIDFTASILYEGSVVAHQVSKTEYILNNDQLSIVRKTKMKGLPMPTAKYTCVRN